MLSDLNGETVSPVTWKYMKVDMKNFLMGGGAVSQKKIDPFTLQAGSPQGLRHSLRRLKYAAARCRVEVGQKGCMAVGHHQNMAGIDGMNIHEYRYNIVSINKRGLLPAAENVTEQTGGHVPLLSNVLSFFP